MIVCVIGWSVVADPGEGPGGAPPLFLDQNETQRAEKKFFEAGSPPPSYLRVWMTPPCLKVWIRHWSVVK